MHTPQNLILAIAYWAIAAEILYFLLKSHHTIPNRRLWVRLCEFLSAFFLTSGLENFSEAFDWPATEAIQILTGVISWITVLGIAWLLPEAFRIVWVFQQAEAHQATLDSILRYALNGVLVLEAVQENARIVDFRYVLVNPSAQKIMRTNPIGESLLRTFPEHQSSGLFDSYCNVIQTGVSQSLETPFTIASVEKWFRVTISSLGAEKLLLMFDDVTEYKRLQRQLRYIAETDGLTGLPNRQALNYPADRVGALLYLDLNRFKQVNDTLGHLAGDRLLQTVAERLRAAVEPCDVVTRLAGDEFVVLLQGEVDRTEAVLIAERLIAQLEQPMMIGSHPVEISASIGIALQVHGSSLEVLLQQADVAMYEGKQDNRSGKSSKIVVFVPSMLLDREMQLQHEEELRKAILNHEMVLHYQPIVDLHQPGFPIKGFEALVRWEHPARGMIPPAQFIPLAEKTGLIFMLFEWVMAEACQQAIAWQAVQPGVNIAVNVSAVQLGQISFSATVARLLKQFDVPTSVMHLEITESALALAEEEIASKTLARLARLKVPLEIDDFGTGYSNLRRLKLIDLDYLKVDRSFTDFEIEANRKICHGIIQMAKGLELQTIGEGVEKLAQAEFLRELGCDFAQGYFFARPMPAAEAEAFLKGAIASGTTVRIS